MPAITSEPGGKHALTGRISYRYAASVVVLLSQECDHLSSLVEDSDDSLTTISSHCRHRSVRLSQKHVATGVNSSERMIAGVLEQDYPAYLPCGGFAKTQAY